MNMHALTTFADWLPVIFMAVMGLAMLAYVILDGYDLGVGILMRRADSADQDMMISSIGPFWDANETWLVLGVGILLTCFPLAHGVILGALYLPVALMLLGLTLRGVAFDFRAKAQTGAQALWNRAFHAGSLIASLSQGWMLGSFILGFQKTWVAYAFSALIAICLTSFYTLLGACWLVMKSEGKLQLLATGWARAALALSALGIIAVSLATPMLSREIFDKWFSLPFVALLAPIPIATVVLFFIADRSLRRLPVRIKEGNRYGEWVPFACCVGILGLSFYGLAYSIFPYLVLELSVWDAASDFESLRIIFFGAAVVLPVIIAYTAFSYRVFAGKAKPLSYSN
jgi:cytochrome bd ubiquinol oxidase subunit II